MLLSREVQNLIRREEEEEQKGEMASEKSQVDVVEAGAKEEKKHSLDFLWHPANHSNPKVCIIMRIWETASNLIANGYIHSMALNIKRLPV